MNDSQPHFDDRLLTCADCHTEFIFTAGEQLFFHDKQFKNDPKRCKPCKSRRSGLAAGANGTGPAAAGISRTETRTECSACGSQTTVPFKPTQGRPVLCRQCFQVQNNAHRPLEPTPAPTATTPYAIGTASSQAQTASVLAGASENARGAVLSAEAAIVAAACMAAASPLSSVATAADLALIATLPSEPLLPSLIPVVLLAAAAEADASAELAAVSIAFIEA